MVHFLALIARKRDLHIPTIYMKINHFNIGLSMGLFLRGPFFLRPLNRVNHNKAFLIE